MAGDMIEARRHLENVLRNQNAGWSETARRENDAAREFLTRLDGEGQSVEGGDWQESEKAQFEAEWEDARFEPLIANMKPLMRRICKTASLASWMERAERAHAELTRLKAEQSDIRNAALEEAAKACDDLANESGRDVEEQAGCDDCAQAIRALMPQPNGGQT